MDIIKRTGKTEKYNGKKIINAIAKSLNITGQQISGEELSALLKRVEEKLEKEEVKSVEKIQDLVELSLMEAGYYEEGKRYILFRQKRFEFRKARGELSALIRPAEDGSDGGLDKIFASIQKTFQEDVYSLTILKAKFISFAKENKLNACIVCGVWAVMLNVKLRLLISLSYSCLALFKDC